MITVLWCVKYARKYILYGFPCEMDFSPLVSESQPRRKRQSRWDSDTRGEKNPSHMENHTKWISSPQLTGCKSHTESSWTPGNRHRLYSWYIHWQMHSDMMYSWNNCSWVISCLASMWIWHDLTSLTFLIPTSQPEKYTNNITQAISYGQTLFNMTTCVTIPGNTCPSGPLCILFPHCVWATVVAWSVAGGDPVIGCSRATGASPSGLSSNCSVGRVRRWNQY